MKCLFICRAVRFPIEIPGEEPAEESNPVPADWSPLARPGHSL